MPEYREIRAGYDRETVVVYQAYAPRIAEPTLAAGRFVEPFSWSRMTWIKPSFLWMMGRSGWATKAGQEFVLAVRISREGWERALAAAVLTSYTRGVHASPDAWASEFESAPVHVQWDPERSLHGRKLEHRAIQVGIGRTVIREYTDEWIVGIEDVTPLVRRIRSAYLAGNHRRAKELLPSEKAYPVDDAIARRLAIGV